MVYRTASLKYISQYLHSNKSLNLMVVDVFVVDTVEGGLDVVDGVAKLVAVEVAVEIVVVVVEEVVAEEEVAEEEEQQEEVEDEEEEEEEDAVEEVEVEEGLELIKLLLLLTLAAIGIVDVILDSSVSGVPLVVVEYLLNLLELVAGGGDGGFSSDESAGFLAVCCCSLSSFRTRPLRFDAPVDVYRGVAVFSSFIFKLTATFTASLSSLFGVLCERSMAELSSSLSSNCGLTSSQSESFSSFTSSSALFTIEILPSL